MSADGTGADAQGGPAVRRLADWDRQRLRSLAAEYGTPLYVFDPRRVRENCRRLQDAFPDAEVQYAAKAHTARRTLETVHDEGLGIECASAGEVVRALDAGVPGADVTYTAVNPPAGDLDVVVDAWEATPELTVTAGAADTIDRLAERGFEGRLRLRVNPGVGAGHHEKVVTGGHPKFGVGLDRAPALAARAASAFEFVGVHAHAGSGISGDDLAAHRELVRRMGDLARELDARGITLDTVDVGGGFGVPYREDAPALDLDAVAEATREALGEVDATLAIEPGRYVVADAGVLLTRVNTVKEAPGTVVAGVDAGMTTLLRPAMYDAFHAVQNLETVHDRETVGVTVAGPVCETADLLCEDRPLPRPERGDLLAVGNAGAYGYEMASTYNSRPRPAEVTVDGDRLRRRETIADLRRLDAPGGSNRRADRRAVTVPFEKYDGAGNDFVVVDSAAFDGDRAAFARAHCDRETGVSGGPGGRRGADGVLFLSLEADGRPARVTMTLVQPDGSIAEMCGNGARCVAAWAAERSGASTVEIDTPAGRHRAVVDDDGVAVAMGQPTFDPGAVPLAGDERLIDDTLDELADTPAAGLSVTAVNTGVPHAVVFVGDVDEYDVDAVAPPIRHADAFPEGANVTFACGDGEGGFRQRTFERGVEGETRACGTGAVAVAAAAKRLGRLPDGADWITVTPPGGELGVTVPDEAPARLRGPAERRFTGDLPVPEGEP